MKGWCVRAILLLACIGAAWWCACQVGTVLGWISGTVRFRNTSELVDRSIGDFADQTKPNISFSVLCPRALHGPDEGLSTLRHTNIQVLGASETKAIIGALRKDRQDYRGGGPVYTESRFLMLARFNLFLFDFQELQCGGLDVRIGLDRGGARAAIWNARTGEWSGGSGTNLVALAVFAGGFGEDGEMY